MFASHLFTLSFGLEHLAASELQSMSVASPCVVAAGRGGTATGVLLGAGCGFGGWRGGVLLRS